MRNFGCIHPNASWKASNEREDLLSADIVLDQCRPVAGQQARSPRKPSLGSLQAYRRAAHFRHKVAQSAMSAAEASGTPMVSIFNAPGSGTRGLNMDRDSQKRDERIMSLLRERARHRVLGAVASASPTRSHSFMTRTRIAVRRSITCWAKRFSPANMMKRLCGLRLLLTGTAGVGKAELALTLAKLLAIASGGDQSSLRPGSSVSRPAANSTGRTPKTGIVWESLVQGTARQSYYCPGRDRQEHRPLGRSPGALFQLLEPRTAAIIFCDKSVPWLQVDLHGSTGWPT